MPSKMTDWKNMTFNTRELVAVVAFVFTMSGVWFELKFGNNQIKQDLATHATDEAKKDVDLNKRILELETRVLVLEKADATRTGKEQAMNDFYPMKKIK